MTVNIATDARFNPAQQQLVGYVAGAIVPACSEQGMLAANDLHILQDILNTADFDAINGFCEYVETVAQQTLGCAFVALNEEQKYQLAQHLAHSNAPEVRGFVSLVVQCYYRDPRVLAALELAARPAYPKGYEVVAGDWTLLEAVKRRRAFFRAVES